MKRIIAVIPARYGSTRFPGKPLAKLKGKEVIRWVIEGTSQSKLIDQVIVATDDQRIATVATAAGVKAVLTDSSLPSGTDRIWAAIKDEKFDIVLNVQGDEPLVNAKLLDDLIRPMVDNPSLEMATLAHPLTLEELHSPNSVKVILNKKSYAIYFSRFPIPYSRITPDSQTQFVSLKHIGLYAYRKDFLGAFCITAPSRIEDAECLEQLRAIDMGARILVVPTEYRSWGVDTPDDLKKIEGILGGAHEK